MKKVLLDMYLNINLGDDLFLKIISERYPNTVFYVQPSHYYPKKNYGKNIVFVRSIVTRGINVLENIVKRRKNILTSILKRKSIAYVVLGGSMFIENTSISKYIKEKNLLKYKTKTPYYIIGSNFGPYCSKEYYDSYKGIFEKAMDVSFRDQHSFNMFKSLNNARVNPDIIFGLNTDGYNKNNQNKIVISIINCQGRFNNNTCQKYEQLILDMIYRFDKKGYKIVLMSFCKFEGDEIAIENIMSKVNIKDLNNAIEQYNYNGNIDEALKILGEATIIIGSRFHANILGLVMNKTIIPIAYSDKTINALKDINYKGKIIDIRKLDDFNIDDLSEKDLSYKLNIDDYRKEAEKHFAKLDKILD